MLAATQQDITAISDLISDLCGIYLDETKGYLIESRLSKLVEEYGCDSFASLATKGQSPTNAELRHDLVELMTTNETLFFRDSAPFNALQHKLLPELIDRRESAPGPTKLRIWSAACSTGQEAYSLAMVLCELIPDVENWDIRILATDVSDDAIKTASAGVYPDHIAARGLSGPWQNKYFRRTDDGWQVDDRVRSLVKFERACLTQSFAGRGQFDVILCRNVAIYFKPELRKDVFQRMYKALAPDGHLMVGCAESLHDMSDYFSAEFHCGATVYGPKM